MKLFKFLCLLFSLILLFFSSLCMRHLVYNKNLKNKNRAGLIFNIISVGGFLMVYYLFAYWCYLFFILLGVYELL